MFSVKEQSKQLRGKQKVKYLWPAPGIFIKNYKFQDFPRFAGTLFLQVFQVEWDLWEGVDYTALTISAHYT